MQQRLTIIAMLEYVVPVSLEDRDERYSHPLSPKKRPIDDFETQPPHETRFGRYHPAHDDPYDAGKPNSQIIFRGLEKDVSETDVYDFFLFRTITDFHSCNNFSTIKALPLKV